MRILAMGAVLALLLLAACGDDDDGGTAPTETATGVAGFRTPTAAVTVTPTPLPNPLGGIEAADLGDGQAVPLDGMALLVATGCFNCDGPTETLTRVYRSISGNLHQDVLFRAEDFGGTSIFGYATVPGLRQIVVSVCESRSCGLEGGVPADVAVTLWGSDDGGVSWAEIDTIGGAVSVNAITLGGLLLTRYRGGDSFEIDVVLYPENEVIEPPEGADHRFAPIVLPDERLLWLNADRSVLIADDGSTVLDLAGARARIGAVVPHPTDGRLLVTWAVGEGGGGQAAIVSDGAIVSLFDAGERAITPWAWLDDGRVLANMFTVSNQTESVPILLDITTGMVSPIDGPFSSGAAPEPGALVGRNYVVGGITGGFAAVANVGPDDCLNIRETPATDGTVLACLGDGVLLLTDGTVQRSGEFEWLSVTTPGGSAGWAATEFLVY